MTRLRDMTESSLDALPVGAVFNVGDMPEYFDIRKISDGKWTLMDDAMSSAELAAQVAISCPDKWTLVEQEQTK